MGRMLRKQIYIEARQDALLKRKAEASGVSEAELIRQALDRQLEVQATLAVPPERKAWEQVRRFILDLRARAPQPGEVRTWKREDLYEERLGRLPSDAD